MHTTTRQSQHGAGMLSLLLCLILAGGAILAALRLVPVYLEYNTVKKELETVMSEAPPNASARALWRDLSKRLNINNVNGIEESDLVVEFVDGGHQVILEYDVIRPFLANIDFLVHFKVVAE